MQFTETKLNDAYVIDLETHNDSRGFFARSFCRKEFLENGIDFETAEYESSMNLRQESRLGQSPTLRLENSTPLAHCRDGQNG